MKNLCIALAASLCAVTAQAASPTPAPAAKAAPAATPAPLQVTPAEQTSALFFSTCVTSVGSEKEFTKQMQALATAKTAVKMAPDKLTGMVNDEEAKNAWAVKGFADVNKPIVITYNAARKICGMHVADTNPDLMRHAFQGDLKKWVDLTKATVKVYKPEKKDDLTAYLVDLTANNKVMQLGIATSAKEGKEFLTVHMQD